MERRTTMIATLGGQPQVVTFALDELLRLGVAVDEVIVLILQAQEERLRRAQRLLGETMKEPRYEGIVYRPHVVRAGSRPLIDIYDEVDANGVWESINQLVIELKNKERVLQVCISGGRRLLGLLTLSAATLHFGHHDKLWHMFTPEEWLAEARDGALMHLPEGSGFRLIEVPMMPWGSYFPALRELARPQVNRGGDVLAGPKAALDEAEKRKCAAVVERLTKRQLEVLRLLAQDVAPQEAAEQLHITASTLNSHKTVILDVCRAVWDVPEGKWLDYHFLVRRFGDFWA